MNHKEALQKISNLKIPRSYDGLEFQLNYIIKLATEAIQSESRMYSEDEMNKCWIQATRKTLEPLTEIGFTSFLQSLQPKTEEQTYGEWMRSDPERPLYDFPNKKICFKSCEQSKIDLGNCDCHNSIMDRFLMPTKEQPTSPSIEKMAEEILENACPILFKPNTDVRKAIVTAMEEYAQHKANNSLEELEKWVKLRGDSCPDFLLKILNKIQELKTKQ